MSLSSLFKSWSKKKILVVGDFMLDTYTVGSVKRVSPEAPVMVVNAQKINKLPGGAGNVALNLASLGAKVAILGRVGEDEARNELCSKLKKEKIDTSSLYVQKNYRTPIKNRIMADNHQIVRVDFEEKSLLSTSLESKIIADLPKILKGVSTVAISDYAKGFLSTNLLKHLIEQANERAIPVIIDPKGKDFSKYRGAYLIKPNLKEAIEASGLEDEASLEEVAKALYQETQVPHIMITKSSAGISLFAPQGTKEYPAKVREVVDVTGAGDTVLATLTYAISHQVPLDHSIQLCNLAAGEVIEHLGCARISIRRLAELILNQHLNHKVFSEKYLEITQFILDHEPFILIELKLEFGFPANLFGQLKTLKKEHPNKKLVVSLEGELQDEALVELLGSLDEVDFIVTSQTDVAQFCTRHSPKQIYTLIDSQMQLKKSKSLLRANSSI